MYRFIVGFIFSIQFFLLPALAAENLSLQQAEAMAVAADLALKAKHSQSLAYSEEAIAAGQLPDPKLFLATANLPTDTWDLDQEPMTQMKVGLRQQFPAGKTTTLRREQKQRSAEQMDRERLDLTLQLRQQFRLHWLSLSGWHQKSILLDKYLPVFEQLVVVTRSMYEGGSKHQQDYLQAELLLGQVKNRIFHLQQKEGEERAWLSRWLGAKAHGPLTLSWPVSWHEPEAAAVAGSHPKILSVDHVVANHVTSIELAEQRYKPNWGLELSYARRETDDLVGDKLPDLFSAMISVDLPLFTDNRQDRQYAAAKHRHAASMVGRSDVVATLNTDLAINRAELQQLKRSVELYERQLLLLGEQQANAAMQAYQSDAADFSDVMQATNVRLELEMDYQNTLQKYYQSLANTYYLLPQEAPYYE